MPWPIPSTEARSREELERHYAVECELADRLRRASREARRGLYGEVYDELFRRVRLPSLAADPDVEGQVVELQYVALRPLLAADGVFLEIGAGSCALAARVAREARRVVAVEASEEAVAESVTGSAAPENLELVLSGEIPLALGDESVDVAYSCHFLEHLHPEDALEHAAEVRRVLRPGGAYLGVTPNRVWGPHDISRYFDDVPRGLHLKEYTHADLARIFRRAGFRRTRVLRGVGVPPRFAPVLPTALAEGFLGALPAALRRRLLARLAGEAMVPFRPLEQVMVVGFA